MIYVLRAADETGFNIGTLGVMLPIDPSTR